jgi:hypothetical protein
MSYIGQGLPADTFQGFTTDKFTGDGTANKAFTLTKEPFSEDTILVTIDGVVQEPTDDFTVSGTTLTLVGTAPNNSEVNVTHMGGPLPIGGAAELDLNGASDKLILDADADTTISADTDDQIDFKAGGTDIMSLTATTVTINDGTTIITNDNSDTLTLQSADADASEGPVMVFDRASSSPADDDVIGAINFRGKDSGGNGVDYVKIQAEIMQEADGSEDGQLQFNLQKAGTSRNILTLDRVAVVINEDSQDIDFRVESNGFSNAFFVSGEYDHHVAIGGTMTSFGVGETLDIGGYGGMFKLDVNNAIYTSANLYYDGSTWDKQTANAYGSIIVQHTGAALPFQIYVINNQSGAAGTNINSALTEHFRMASDGTLTATDQEIGAISDQRLKENIQDYTYDINKFKSFKPRTFDWKHPEAHTDQPTTGFVAQELESVDSNWVYETIWDDAHKGAKHDEEKALCNNEPKKAAKLSKKDAMYISVIQQLITRIEALEDA